MTPKQLEEASVKWENEKPHELRDELSEEIWCVIRYSNGYVQVSYKFSIDGDPVIEQVYNVHREIEKDLLFSHLATVRELLRDDNYIFTYEVKRIKG